MMKKTDRHTIAAENSAHATVVVVGKMADNNNTYWCWKPCCRLCMPIIGEMLTAKNNFYYWPAYK